jgi:hypothetical protein
VSGFEGWAYTKHDLSEIDFCEKVLLSASEKPLHKTPTVSTRSRSNMQEDANPVISKTKNIF